MPPAKKRRVAAAKAAAESNFDVGSDDTADVAMTAANDDANAANAAIVVPPPPPSNADPAMSTSASDIPQPNHSVPENDFHQHGILTAKLFDMHRSTLKTLQDNIAQLALKATTTSDNSNNNVMTDDPQYNEHLLTSSLALSNLKSLQRRLALQVEEHATISKSRRDRVEQYSLLLENLMYERQYLQHEIMDLSSWKPEDLEKMAWSELGIGRGGTISRGGQGGGGSSSTSGGDGMEVDEVSSKTPTKITTAEEAIDAYLFGNTSSEPSSSSSSSSSPSAIASSHRDPSQHQFILQKIQSDLEARASLVEQLSKSKLELRELQKKRDNLRGFLNMIPKKVMELEKAGESLNIFFGNSAVWKDVLVSNEGKNDEVLKDDTDEAMMDVAVSDNDAKKSNEKKQVQAANLLVHRASSDRTKRFQMAQSNLPSPLYVLFVQLMGYIDAWATLDKLGGLQSNNVLDGLVGANGMNVSVVPNETGDDGDDKWSVVLTLSPADILPPEVSSILGKSYSTSRSSSSAGAIKIVFSFNDNLGVVLVHAAEGDGEMNGELLDNLFPGDDGLSNPNVALSLLDEEGGDEGRDHSISTGGDNQDEKDGTNSNTSIWKFGKPYYWCQVLSGLDFPPPMSAANSNDKADSGGEANDAPFQIQTCTKAVFRQLTRRIRARKTLASILDYLGKRSSLHPLPIPIHPAMKVEDSTASQSQSAKVKLHSWTEDSKDGNQRAAGTTRKTYIAIIKRKSSTLKATVTVDMQNYPADPPVWSLQNEDGSVGMPSSWAEEHGSVSSLQQSSNSNTKTLPPLFDATLHRIEYHVNQDLDKFVNQSVESTFDWILIHQLADIMSCWDEVMIACDGNVGGSNNASKGGGELGIIAGQVRMRKGRDRRLIGFGERSPFFWYRKGL